MGQTAVNFQESAANSWYRNKRDDIIQIIFQKESRERHHS